MPGKEYQEHEGAKDANTLYAQYDYDTAAKGWRLKSTRYPNARVVHYTYETTGDVNVADKLSRLSGIRAVASGAGTTFASYSYNGVGRMVRESFEEPGVRLDYGRMASHSPWKNAGAGILHCSYAAAATSGTYAGFDRFGRVKQQFWLDGDDDDNDDDDLDGYTYGHDRNSNRLYRENTNAAADKDEAYTYNRLNQLTALHRGDLDGNNEIPAGNRVRGEAWTLSPVGNWNEYKIDENGDGDFVDAEDLDQDRTHNDVNEITGITEQADPAQWVWAHPAWSARGNMTAAPQPTDMTSTYACKYDAWNRLVEVKDGATVIAQYEYDGLNRRVKKYVPGQEPDPDSYRHFYYNTGWQLLETRENDDEETAPQNWQPEYQYVWSARYIDAPILRDKNTDQDGLCDDERLYYTTDANMNVTALVLEDEEDVWIVVERYQYSAYGVVTVMDGVWESEDDTNYDNVILFAGYYRDPETWFYHVRNRPYHAELGRFLQRDPIDYPDGMSLYEYVMSRPADYTDPSGLSLRLTAEPANDPGAANMLKQLTTYIKTICDKATVDNNGNVAVPADLTGSKTPAGCCCVQEVVKKPHAWVVKGKKMTSTRGDWPGTDPNDRRSASVAGPGRMGRPGKGSGGTIYTPVEGGGTVWQSFDKQGKLRDAPNWRVLAHELCGHALPAARGEHWTPFPGHRGRRGDRPFHDQAIAGENAVAAEHQGQVPRGLWADPKHGESAARDGVPK